MPNLSTLNDFAMRLAFTSYTARKCRQNWRDAALGMVGAGVSGVIVLSPKVHRGGIR